MTMRLKCIGCEVLARAVYHCAAESPHTVDVDLLQLGLHNYPAELRSNLQSRIDTLIGSDYQAILLAYGLCGQATAGLVARDKPLVIARAHDCISLFLGSRQRYQEQFSAIPGTFWYSIDYIERRVASHSIFGLGSTCEADAQKLYEEYVAKYGKDNADYLMEVMNSWKSHYQRAVFIDLGLGDGHQVEMQAQVEATQRGWMFQCLSADLKLIHQLIQGNWQDNPDFIIVKPGNQITMTADDLVMDQYPFSIST